MEDREERLQDDAACKMEKRRKQAEEKLNQQAEVPFPPVINDETLTRCLMNYIKATSNASLRTAVCAICAEFCHGYEKLDVWSIPNRELIQQETSGLNNLEEYVVEDLLLHKKGVDEDLMVNCCLRCLSSLKKEKLPAFSIANNLQIGETPLVLSSLTLPEKLLISVYRPKIYVITFRSVAGPGTAQRGLKGNTITFPQDIVKIAQTLPSDTNVLADIIKVVFIGSGVPSKNTLKKVLTVRREKRFDALAYLVEHHPLYTNVKINQDIDLPVDDIPDALWEMMTVHDDAEKEEEKEHANYTPQTELHTTDNSDDGVIMDSSGMLDLEGSSVSTDCQMKAAVQSLQGTLFIPHGSLPITEYNNPLLWIGAYPWLFPHGMGGPEISRKIPISLKAYVRHLLLHADKKFRLDLSFKFHVFNVLQKRDVSLHTSIHIRHSRFHTAAAQMGQLTHDSLVKLLESIDKKTPVNDPNLKVLLNNLSSTGAKIQGSPYCKKSYRREIFGLMVHFGMPAFWITISPATIHSPILLQLAGQDIDLDNILTMHLPSSHERAKIVAQDPVAAAQFFNIVIDAFTTTLLGYNQLDGGIFGHIAGYFGCIEEQGTGTLHIHMLVWLQGFVSRSELESKFNDENFKKRLLEYLESIIKQGYLDDFDAESTNIDVSEVSCKRPVDPTEEEFESKLAEDVNKLVTVANTHRHSFTCNKYRKVKECRFGFPREILLESEIKENEIFLKRTNPVINNYNPIVMTCMRCNQDIKFIPSGKDGKACAFYMTDYSTKSSLSCHQMIPLIAASIKKIDSPNSNLQDLVKRSKIMITKCLNRITTETEMSGSHICHFLLGNSDKKTSHTFSRLNLHAAMSWLAEENHKYDCIDIIDNDDGDEYYQQNDKDDDDPGYVIEHGNAGLILINQLVDYLNRGDGLLEMALYEYCSKIYKVKLTAEEERKIRKFEDPSQSQKVGRKLQQRFPFSNNHPQSETHVQRIRTEPVIPSLSFFPPSENHDKERFYRSLLALFKPFTEFQDLFNGISWEDSFHNTNFGDNSKYIINIKEMHQGIQERQAKKDDVNADDESDHASQDDTDLIIDDNSDDDSPFVSSDTNTANSEVVQIIRDSGYLINFPDMVQQKCSFSATLLQQQQWKSDIQGQSESMQQQLYFGEMDEENIEQINIDDISWNGNDDDIHLVINDNPVQDKDVQVILSETEEKYSLNSKQKVVFKLITRNVIKRLKNESVEQIIAYVGGAGGTGKSQIIKAVVHFHNEIKLRHTLRLCAYTGTAAKLIGGSTISSIAMIRNANIAKLEKIWGCVNTVLLDEVSMTGCRLLTKLSRNITIAKHESHDIPFGGVDMIFFGDFSQYPPVLDTPLYSNYSSTYTTIKASTSQSDVLREVGRSLWKQLTHVALLTQQMRVTDPAYQDVLNRLREGKSTIDDYILLSSRVIGNSCSIDSTPTMNPIIVPGNDLRREINSLFVKDHSKALSQKILTSRAIDLCKRGNLTSEHRRLIRKLPNTKIDGFPGDLPLYIGMSVFLTKNVSTELGLTNGTSGVIRQIICNPDEKLDNLDENHILRTQPQYVVVEFKDLLLKSLNGLPQNHVPIFPRNGTFSIKYNGSRHISISRKQLPLEPAYSCTSHKCQGQTLHKVIVDLMPPKGMKKIDTSFSYVPLSRVRTLKDLTILRPFDSCTILRPIPDELKQMMEAFTVRDVCKYV